MTLSYAGWDLTGYTSKYGVSVIPRTVEGPNRIDSIAGTHEPDPLAAKLDVVVRCIPLSDSQLDLLWTMVRDAVSMPYLNLTYVSGNVSITGQYRISVGKSDAVIDTSERKLFGGVVLTFTQR